MIDMVTATTWPTFIAPLKARHQVAEGTMAFQFQKDAAPSHAQMLVMVRSDLFAFQVSKPVQSLRFSGSLVRRIK